MLEEGIEHIVISITYIYYICKINLLPHCHSLDNIGNKANELADITIENMKRRNQVAGKLFDKIRYQWQVEQKPVNLNPEKGIQKSKEQRFFEEK